MIRVHDGLVGENLTRPNAILVILMALHDVRK